MAGRSPGWIVRERLLAALHGHPVVLLQAAGGWGKTTLAEQVAMRRQLAVVHVRLQSPTSIAELLTSVRRALHRAGFADLSASVDETQPEPTLDELLARLRGAPPLALLIDEAQLLDDDAARWVRALTDDVPEEVTLIVAGRTLPRAITRRQRPAALLLTSADLAFDADELAGHLGDHALAAGVVQRTGGWAVAVALALRADDPLLALDSPSMVDSMLDDALGDDRDRVAPLAHLPLLSREVAIAVAGDGAFEALQSSGIPLARSGEWWVLPDPIKDALGREGRLDPAVAAQAARHYDLATAAGFLARAASPEAVAEVLAQRHWSELLDLGVHEIDAWFAAAGRAALAEHPRALLNAARAVEQRDPQRRAEWLGRAATHATGPLAHEVEAERIRDLLRSPNPDDAVAAAGALLDRLEPGETAARARTLLSLGIAHAFRPTPDDLALADRLLNESRSLCALVGERRWESDALNRLAILVNHNTGREELAAEQMAASLALLPTGSRDWALGLTYYSDILDYLGRTVEAEAAAKEAWEVGRRRGDQLLIAFGAWALAIVRCHAGDLEGTRRWLDEVECHPGTWMATANGLEYLAFACDLLANLGDVDAARQYRERLSTRADEAMASLIDVVDSRLEAMYGDPARALQILDRLPGTAYATPGTDWVRNLFRALALSRIGRGTEATERIRDTLATLERNGGLELPARHERLVVQMLAAVWPGGPTATAPARLDVALLGRFAVLRGADVVTPAPGHPATLVKLVALRGTLATEQVIDLLWPDADVATGRARLRNLLNRVRTQSGDLLHRHGEVLELAPGVETDVARFELAATRSLEAPTSERAGLARLAIGAYPGDLLPGDLYEDWAAGPRERLRRRYLSLIDVVAEAALAENELDDALRLLDLAIAAEPLEEGRYVTAARALLQHGRRAAAREYAVSGAAALAELGLEPGPALSELLGSR